MNNDPLSSEDILSESELIAFAREDFAVFVELAFPVLHEGKPLVHAPYMDVMVEALMGTRLGIAPWLIFNLPPGFMKSMLISVLYTAWLLGVDPTAKIICASYGDDLTHSLSRTVRRLMSSPLYRAIFPDTILEKKAEDSIETTRGGRRYATAVGSEIAGFRADLIIIDDPMQPDESANELAKQRVRDWYDGVVAQRLIDPAKGAIILVMHRLAPDDLTGTFIERGGWKRFSFPLIETEPSKEWADQKGRVLLRREQGDILNPVRTTKQAAEDRRATTPSHIFDAQYQQNPRFGGSGICSVDRFVRYKDPPPFQLIIHSWDLAATKDGGDWTVCAKFGLARDDKGRDVLFLLQIIRIRRELPDVRAVIIEEDSSDKPALICLDANGVGLYIYQDFWREGRKHIVHTGTLNTAKTGDLKVRRFHETFPLLYDGLIRIPEVMPGLETLLGEFASFPDGKNDDQVDAVTAVGAHRGRIITQARSNADRYGRWAATERARLEKALRDRPAPLRLKPHEQRFRLRHHLPI